MLHGILISVSFIIFNSFKISNKIKKKYLFFLNLLYVWFRWKAMNIKSQHNLIQIAFVNG